ncbi:MAG: hypothetical protein ACK5L5_06445 [Bacteroidales bacterium]
MDWIRKEIFCKYMGAPYFSSEKYAKFGWEYNHIGLEPAKFKSGAIGATTWVHIDVREFSSAYKEDMLFIKEKTEIASSRIVDLI